MVRLEYIGPRAQLHPLLAIPGIDGSIGSVEPLVRGLGMRRPVAVAVYTDERHAKLEGLTAEIAACAVRELAPPFDILGQSIGTILAAQVAAQHPHLVRKVVLISTFTRLRWNTLRLNNFLVKLSPRWLYRLTTRPVLSCVCGPVGDGAVHPFFTTSRESDPDQVRKRTQWEIGRDFSSDLRAVLQPTLVLMGAKDRFVPNASREIAKLRELFSGQPAQVVALPDTGHVLLPSASIARAVKEVEAFLNAHP